MIGVKMGMALSSISPIQLSLHFLQAHLMVFVKVCPIRGFLRVVFMLLTEDWEVAALQLRASGIFGRCGCIQSGQRCSRLMGLPRTPPSPQKAQRFGGLDFRRFELLRI